MKKTIDNQSIRREDLIRYASSEDNSYNQQLENEWMDNPFVSDAMEGIRIIESPQKRLKRLDRKFMKRNLLYSIIGASSILVLVFGLYIWNMRDVSPSLSVKKNTAPLKQESNGSKEKDKQQSVREPNQPIVPFIQLETVNEKYVEIANVVSTDLEKLQLPIKKMVGEIPNPELINTAKLGKEIYLHSLKAIDYRSYRSRPIGQSTPAISGTPAFEAMEIPELTLTDSIPYIDFLDASLSLVERKQYKRAIPQFVQILSTYPTDVNALFYAGLCCYHANEYTKAISYFKQLEMADFTNFDEEVEWFQWLCFNQLKDQQNSARFAAKIRTRNGFYAKKLDQVKFN
jgi:TolA-binding protein